MARAHYAGLALLACLVFLPGCGHEARVAVRNVAEIGEYLATQGPDDTVRAAGRAIQSQSTAAADQMDLLLYGLMARHTEATVTAQDWIESPTAAERHSGEQARRVEAETAQIQAVSAGVFAGFGLGTGLTGTGIIGLGLAWFLKNQGTVKELVSYAANMRKAETEDDAKKVEEAHPSAHKVVAKAVKAGKVA